MNPVKPKTESGLWGPLLLISALIFIVIWLSSGSSNQASQTNWSAGWLAEPSFNYPRRAPAAVTHNGYIYIVGGIDGNERYVHTVEYAPIKTDGRLGQWRTTSSLNEGRFYNATVAANGYLYALGGGNGAPGSNNYPIASVERATIKADGSLGPWQQINAMLSPRRGLKTVLYNDTIYAIGGYDGRFLKSIEQSRIQTDGNLSTWQMEQHRSVIDRYIHSAALFDQTIYLLGGHMRNTNQASYSDVETSQITAAGRLTPWQQETHGLQTPRLVAESFTLGRFLYIAGGHTGTQRLNSVEVSNINNDGTLSPWRYTTLLPQARSAYAVATWGGKHVYLLGGGGDGTPLNNVIMASVNHAGDLGVFKAN